MTTKHQVHTAEQAVVYLCECTLATVDSLSMKKKPPAGEYSRQISIAQTAIDWIINLKIDVSKESRVRSVVFDHNRSVQAYADNVRSRFIK